VVASVTNSDGILPEECVLCSKIKVFMFFVQSESCKNEIKVAEVAAEVKSKLSTYQNFYFCPVTTVIGSSLVESTLPVGLCSSRSPSTLSSTSYRSASKRFLHRLGVAIVVGNIPAISLFHSSTISSGHRRTAKKYSYRAGCRSPSQSYRLNP
jgi:hypothetical protein